jgi:hypothetical protein
VYVESVLLQIFYIPITIYIVLYFPLRIGNFYCLFIAAETKLVAFLVNNFQNNTCFVYLSSTFIEQLRKSRRVSVRLAPFKIYNSNHKYVCMVGVYTHRRPCRRPAAAASHKFIHTQLWSFPFYAKSLALLKLFYLGELWSAGLCSNVGVGGGGGDGDGGSAVPYSYIYRARARSQIRG